jgi:hypothetical protein
LASNRNAITSPPVHIREGSGTRCVHRIGHDVQAVTEQVAVEVERHGGRLVPEHLLDHLDICAGRDRQRRRGVPQLVRVKTGDVEGAFGQCPFVFGVLRVAGRQADLRDLRPLVGCHTRDEQKPDWRRAEQQAQVRGVDQHHRSAVGGHQCLSGDVAAAIGDLKVHQEGELLVPGSGVLVRWLLANDFVDQLDLVTYPVVVGQGIRLFPDTGPDMALDLVTSRSTKNGVTIQTYRPTGRPQYVTATTQI